MTNSYFQEEVYLVKLRLLHIVNDTDSTTALCGQDVEGKEITTNEGVSTDKMCASCLVTYDESSNGQR